MLHIAQVTVECNIHEEQSGLRGQPAQMGPITDVIKRTFCAHGSSFEAAMSECLDKAVAFTKREAEGLRGESR